MSNSAIPERHVVAWVDDDSEYRALVREWLEPRYEVREFGAGDAFLASLETQRPDVILLDVGLPDMDGFSVCRRLRERGIDAPVLFLTSSNDQDDFLRHMDLDATGYLMKPIGRAQLLSRLAEVVDGERITAGRWKESAGWMPPATEKHALRGTGLHKAR
jgi:two-component system, OmpR family, response regulator